MSWKTEFINRLLTKDQQSAYYVLDLDQIRGWMPDYRGNYAEKYTKGVVKILEMLFDECVSEEYNFILDGTFTNTEVIDRNIQRLIEKKYKIQIFYIHTQPYLAWAYTLLRGSDDNRRIPAQQFIRFYRDAYENVNRALDKFGENIHILIVQKIRKEGDIDFDANIRNPRNSQELRNIFDKEIVFYYTFGKEGIYEKLFFGCTQFISYIPVIGKPILRQLAKIRKK